MKRGSALLVVLGMLAFMVISAVAFSAFMRYSRLPSSYLRRTSSSRQLVKAALAEAIDIVDAAVADNPHPGVGSGSISYPRDGTGMSRNRNYWRNHVFTGTNQLVAAEDTVSTLTLEGLAYLPPALINEARFYSRHSTAGMWHTFGYDSGRFAFCAVDVSDHLNVNKTPADIGRGSSPENRFSLAYVFENDGHTAYTLQPSKWDAFMENYVSFADVKDSLKMPEQKGSASSSPAGQNKLPFVSLADLNLAVNKDGGDFKQYFPFVGYLEGGLSELVVSPTGPMAEMQRHMAFVTDGYYPTSGGTGADDDYDLSDDKYQPFTGDNLQENNAKVIRTIIDKSTPGATRLRDYIGRLGLVHLWDYLDEDNVPVSLAIPSVERIPMICGIKATMNGSSIKTTESIEDNENNGNTVSLPITGAYNGTVDPSSAAGLPTAAGVTRKVYYYKKYKLDKQAFVTGIRGGSIKAVVAYPFRRGIDLKDPDSFTIDGHVEFFFTTGNFKFRTGNQGDVLHFSNSGDFGASQYKGDGVFHVPLTSQSCTFNNVTDEESALQELDFMMGPGSSAIMSAIDENPMLTVTWEQEQTSVDINAGTGQPPVYQWEDSGTAQRKGAKCGLPPLAANGEVDPAFASQNALLGLLNGGGADVTLRMAVYLRIKNGDGKTVDLVPASLLDDKNFNNINNFSSMGPVGNTMSGQAYPVMRFTCGNAFKLTDAPLSTAVAADALPKGIMCADPRWNWAPEHWFEHEDVSKANWLQNCGKGTDGRDRDIFMATSDAGYLQSVYELAFLPRIAGNFRPDTEIVGSMENPDDDRTSWANSLAGTRNSGLMWRTYRPFDRPNATRDDFESIGFVSDGGGIKLNPYSDNENILIAAFANTPESWWSASANTEMGLSTSERKAETFNKKYAFSKMNSKAKFDWEDLVRVTASFKSKMQGQTTINGWIDGYDDLWASDGDNENRLMGADLQGDTDDLYGVDRKFLYGYWRDCFAVKQQLFLVFVRAEPMMMGGGAIGQTPPQLGARAVALVWRNPHRGSKSYTETGNDGSDTSAAPANAPHQTRVLFYRQFD